MASIWYDHHRYIFFVVQLFVKYLGSLNEKWVSIGSSIKLSPLKIEFLVAKPSLETFLLIMNYTFCIIFVRDVLEVHLNEIITIYRAIRNVLQIFLSHGIILNNAYLNLLTNPINNHRVVLYFNEIHSTFWWIHVKLDPRCDELISN